MRNIAYHRNFHRNSCAACAHAQNRFDQPRPNLCLTETRVTADKNQIKLSVFVTRFVTVHQNSTGKTLGKLLVLGL